jgi:hypothetical protein
MDFSSSFESRPRMLPSSYAAKTALYNGIAAALFERVTTLEAELLAARLAARAIKQAVLMVTEEQIACASADLACALAAFTCASAAVACASAAIACASAAFACSPAARALALPTGSGGLAFVLWDNRNGCSAGRLGPAATIRPSRARAGWSI